MAIRPAEPEDAAEIVGLVERAYHPYVDRIGMRPAPLDADPEELIADEQVFVLTEGAQVAGLIVLQPCADHLLVENVAVDPQRQHCGNGRALLDFAALRCRELGLDELRLYTNVAMTENLALYPRLGWSEYDRRVEDGFSRVYFRKPVPKGS